MKTPENGDLLRLLSVTECVTQGFWVLQGEKARIFAYARIVQQAVAQGRGHQNVYFSLDNDTKICHNDSYKLSHPDIVYLLYFLMSVIRCFIIKIYVAMGKLLVSELRGSVFYGP